MAFPTVQFTPEGEIIRTRTSGEIQSLGTLTTSDINLIKEGKPFITPDRTTTTISALPTGQLFSSADIKSGAFTFDPSGGTTTAPTSGTTSLAEPSGATAINQFGHVISQDSAIVESLEKALSQGTALPTTGVTRDLIKNVNPGHLATEEFVDLAFQLFHGRSAFRDKGRTPGGPSEIAEFTGKGVQDVLRVIEAGAPKQQPQDFAQFEDFSLDEIPSILDQDFLEDLFVNPTTMFDIEALIAEQRGLQQQFLESLAPTPEEQALQTQLADLRQKIEAEQLNVQAGIFALEDQPIPTPLIQGQQAALERQAAIKFQALALSEGNLIRRLEMEQDARQAKTESLGAAIGFSFQNAEFMMKAEDRVIEQRNQLFSQVMQMQTQSRNTLTTVLDEFEGLTFDMLSPQAQQQLVTISANAGIPFEVLAQGMEVRANDKALADARNVQYIQGVGHVKFTPGGGYDVVIPEQNIKTQLVGNKLINSLTGETIREFDVGDTGEISFDDMFDMAIDLMKDGEFANVNDAFDAVRQLMSGGLVAPPAIDAGVDQIAEAIRSIESNDNYSARGGSGEFGAYQFMPGTWDAWSKEFSLSQGKGPRPLNIRSQQNQDNVAKFKISQWLAQGYNSAQIASLWNSGKPDARGNIGVNQFGQRFNTPNYVDRFNNVLGNITGEDFGNLSPIAQGVVDGTVEFTQLTPTIRAEIVPELNKIGYSTVVSNEDKQDLAFITSQLDELQLLWNNVPNRFKGAVQGRLSEGIGLPFTDATVPFNLSSFNIFSRTREIDPSVAEFEAQKAIIGMTLTRLFEKGRISDQDREFYLKQMPNLVVQDPEVIAARINRLKEVLFQKMRNQINELNRGTVESTIEAQQYLESLGF